MSIVLQSSGGGSVTLQEAVTASNLTITVPAVSATMATLTTPSFATTIGVGGATPAASGAGITFPATQSASSDANTLDDYEEGTFTPTLFGNTTAGTTTYTSQAGVYTKIGRQVTVTVFITASAATGTGELRIGNLPFTVQNSPNYFAAAYVTSLNWGGGTYQMIITRPLEVNVEMQYMTDDGTSANQAIVNETQGIGFTLTYFT
jgi:hypothetical protein